NGRFGLYHERLVTGLSDWRRFGSRQNVNRTHPRERAAVHRGIATGELEKTMPRLFRTIFGIVFLAACAIAAAPEPGLKSAIDLIKPAAILDHIKVLASDQFEGRGPGTAGEEKTVAYLTAQFQKMGLKAGNPDGTFVQNVP